MRRVRALSPHIGARAELHGRRVTVWRARVGETGSFVPVEVQPEGGRRMELRRVAPRASGDRPARARAAFDGRAARLRGRARTPTARSRSASAGARRPRPRARAAARVRHGPARARTLDHGIETLGTPARAQARPAGARGAAARRLPARLPRRRPAHAAVNESVELVRSGAARAGGPVHERRHAAARGRRRGLCDSLPEATPEEAALRHSYPDWIAETWWRDLGADEALALMRAQNEPPETVVRLVRGEVDGRADRRPRRLRRRAGRRDGARRGPDLAAEPRLAARRRSPSARCRASGCSTSAPRRAARRRCSPARSSRSRCNAARAARAGGERAPARRDERPRRQRRRARASGRARRLRPRARRRALLGARRARVAGPTCAGAPQPLPELQLELLRAAAERVEPGGTVVYSVCTLNADENEAVVDAVAAGSCRRPARRRVAGVPRTARGRSSCRRCRTCTARAASSSPALSCAERGRCRSTIAPWRWSDWIRDGVEVEPSLYAADFARLGEQIDALLGAGCRVFHFDVGDGHFVPPGDDGAGRAAVDRAEHPRGRRRARLSPDGRRPGAPLRGVRRVGRRLGHLPRRGHGRSRPRSPRTRARTGSASASPSTPRRRPREPPTRRPRPGADIVLCMSIHPGLLGPGVHAGGARPDRRAARRSSTSRSRSTAASARRTRRRSATAGATLLVAGSAVFGDRATRPRRTDACAPRSHEHRAGARARRRGRGARLSEPDRRRRRRLADGEIVGEGVDRAGRRPARGGRRARRRG